MGPLKLIDIVAQFDTLGGDLVIYAVEPWTCDSAAVLVRDPPMRGVPAEAEAIGAVYFIEIFALRDYFGEWSAPVRERCERYIRYAIDDA